MNPAQHELLNPVETLLAQAKKANIDAFEIEAKLENGFEVTARMDDVENVEHHRGKAMTITVYKNQCTASAATSDLSSKALTETLQKAITMARYAEPDPFAGLADKNLLAYDYRDLQLSHPWSLKPEQAIALALRCDQVARQTDQRISQTEEAVVTTNHHYYVYANSNDFLGHFATSVHGMSISVVAESNGFMERDYYACYSRKADELDSPEKIAETAAHRAVRRLNARKISTRRCPVIFENRVAKSLIQHFISAISGRMLYRQQSFLQDSLGKTVFPTFVNIYQRPHLLSGYGSLPFDSEGVLTKDLDYVIDGRVSHYVLGSYSSRKLGMTTTGNASGVYNLFISHSNQNLQQLCAQMKTGLLVTELLGQGVNLLTGNYSRGAAGFWIEDGVPQFPVHEITIAGNLRDMFANIVAIGNDIETRSNTLTGSMVIGEMVIAGE
ncbi:MAG: metalloprotease PmbA [Coxiella sp. RIFCSPHIGHO2_12_FULL_44_14]|nr:MAG: metalloprotease PmbA [Coxiella sp. RIFCSPHIGHO2_12_FULL_44_14]